jgi:hypothetical protein
LGSECGAGEGGLRGIGGNGGGDYGGYVGGVDGDGGGDDDLPQLRIFVPTDILS